MDMIPFEPSASVRGDLRAGVCWLCAPDGGWFHRRAPEEGMLRAGIVRFEAGSFSATPREPEDSFVISGSAVLSPPGGVETSLTPGTALALDPGVESTWRIDEPLVRFVVFGGVAPNDARDHPVRCATFSEQFTSYGGDTILGGSIERTILWLREGPEGTGAFFSGLLTIEAGQYRKQYVVDEYVLVLEGTRRVEIDGQVHTLTAGEVGAFAKGATAVRTVTSPVRQFFAGR